MAAVAPELAAAGCRTFFVATLDEGMALRRLLPQAVVYVLNGTACGGGEEMAQSALRPVLNSLPEMDEWAAQPGRPAAALHIDTGLNRLGLSDHEVTVLAGDRRGLDRVAVDLVLSHLAAADEPSHPLNRAQLTRFEAALARLFPDPARRPRLSLAASSGIFLGADYCFELTRPGASMYGISPFAEGANPMAQVARLQGRILQTRDIDTGGTVGYGATYRATRATRVATVAVGYADGYFRSLGNRGGAHIGGQRLPVVGRVSMDLITLDVTDAPQACPGAFVDLIGPDNPVDAVAAEAGTNGYELLARMGARIRRRYVNAGTP
jgi:alanine racemase